LSIDLWFFRNRGVFMMSAIKSLTRYGKGLAIGASVILASLSSSRAQETGDEFPWTLYTSAGWLDYEGDEAVDDSLVLLGSVGYDWTHWWTFEGGVILAPELKGQKYYNYDSGTKVLVNRLEEETGVDSTWGGGVFADALFHFTPWKRVDPFLSAGVGVMKYADDINGDNGWDATVRAGLGVMYHFNDEWALRLEYNNFVAGSAKQGDANTLISAGLCWTWGAHVPANYKVAGGPKDSDADGLFDAEEVALGTDPYHPDTDRDKLSDYDEVRTYKTDPLNPDTDFDGLQDGAEVFIHKTNPLNPDTDNGGVRDGHEVIEDNTNPLNPADDLILITLNIQFDYDKAIIKPEYFAQLDLVAEKMLIRYPGSTARIEGHADKLKGSKEKYNMDLSKRRAQAVVDYLVKSHKVDPKALTAHGYGFSRPKALNDPILGNEVNRRVEVYIRKADQQPAAATAPAR
jgi:outer membrane protein OmpA-like peptidoglycan-associated protein